MPYKYHAWLYVVHCIYTMALMKAYEPNVSHLYKISIYIEEEDDREDIVQLKHYL